MAYRVKLLKKWKNMFDKEYRSGTVLTLMPNKGEELVKRGVALKYEGEYPPRSKHKMNLEQLNQK
jgi:hypothetical protein